jgi:acetylornithine deacetylase/succinyl-diaminopimelate desuccinylase-like protein
VASPSPAPSPSFEKAKDFSARKALEHVRFLAGEIGPRAAPSKAFRRAARYVRDQLEALGYRVRLDPVETTGEQTWNVRARWPGGEGRPVILGAHLDTVIGSPGANDNASGVAVLLEVARALAGTREALTVRFMAYGGEERQPAGGHHFGSLADAEGTRARAMVSVDMIALDAELIVGWMGAGRRRAVRALLRSARTLGIPARERVLGDVSDNGPYERAGVPSALLWTGPEPNYHGPGDLPPNVSRRALGRVGRLLLAALRMLGSF